MPKVHGKQIKDGTITSTQAETTTGTISTVEAGDSSSGGSSSGLSNRDHQHAVSTAAPGAATVSAATAAEGSATSLMRSDASIQADVSGTLDSLAVGQSGSDGSGDGLSLKTHAHAVPAATAIEITDSTSSAGSGGSFVHANHQHAHGNRGGGALHSAVTTSVNGFMSAADKTKLDALVDPNLLSPKDAVRLLSTANVTLSGNQTVDGVLTAPGERVAVFSQSTATENGIYETAAGAWARSADFALGSSQSGAVFPVQEGTANDDTIWMVTNDPGSDVVGTDTLTVLLIGAGAPRGAGAGLVLNSNDLDVVANADGSIVVNSNDIQVGVLATDAQHGVRGGGTQHAVAIAGGAAGFLSGADKTIIDALPATSASAAIDLTAGAGLTGGGDLSANRTFDVVANADASIVVNANDIQVGVLASDAQHGVRGGGTQHAVVIAGGAAGFMSGADKTKLDGIDTGAEVNETPNNESITTEAITGTDTALTDTLSNTPVTGSVQLFLNGVLQEPGAGNDYTLSGSTITWLASSGTAVDMEVADVLWASYLS